MTMTIAICAMVDASRASQKARKPGILKRFGEQLTAARLAASGGSGNRLVGRRIAEPEAVDQPWHGQALDEDREGDDDEGGDDDRVALGHGRRDRERQAPAPERRAARPRTGCAGRTREGASATAGTGPRADRSTGRARRARAGSRLPTPWNRAARSGWLATFIPIRMKTRLLARNAKYSHAQRTRGRARRPR